jgi:hypothetical protein
MVGTAQVLDQLRAEGFEVSHSYLGWLIRDRLFIPPEKAPGGAWVWQPADIERLRQALRRRGRGPERSGGAIDERHPESSNRGQIRVDCPSTPLHQPPAFRILSSHRRQWVAVRGRGCPG